MALDPSTRYAGQVDTTDPAGYPYGAAQNVVDEGDGIGTPLEKDLVSDLFGMQQALLTAAGITPSNVPDKVGASQYLEAIRWIAEGSRATFNVQHADYGAIGDGVADDTVAVQAALTAAGVVRGRVHFPDGRYRVVAKLVVPAGVSLFGIGVVTLLKDHASAGFLSWESGTDAGCGVTVEDLRFEGAQVNTGRVFNVAVGVAVTFIRCSVNLTDNKLRGQIVKNDSSDAKIKLVDCIAAMKGTSEIAIEGLGAIDIRGGAYTAPASYASSNCFVDFLVSRCTDVSFTQLLSDVGGFAFIFAHDAVVKGCKFRVTDNGASDLTYATAIVAGSLLVSSGNDFGTNDNGYCFPCRGTGAVRGSVIQMLPAVRQTVAGGTLVLEAHYESITVKYTASSPTFELPDPKVENQRLNVTFFNVSGGPLGFGVDNYGFKASQPTPTNNSAAAATFVATDPLDTGTLVWSQVGDWGSIAA